MLKQTCTLGNVILLLLVPIKLTYIMSMNLGIFNLYHSNQHGKHELYTNIIGQCSHWTFEIQCLMLTTPTKPSQSACLIKFVRKVQGVGCAPCFKGGRDVVIILKKAS